MINDVPLQQPLANCVNNHVENATWMKLQVMQSIQHPDEYYADLLRLHGLLWEHLSTGERMMFVAQCKADEATIIIHAARTRQFGGAWDIEYSLERKIGRAKNVG